MSDPTHVLMIEDNSGDVMLVEEAMASAGLSQSLQVVRDGVDAMDYLRRVGLYSGAARPDVIVLDLRLPRKSGREVLDEIFADPELSAMPVVVLSSSKSDLELVRALGLRGVACIPKPDTFAGYVDLIRRIEAFRRHPKEGGNHGS